MRHEQLDAGSFSGWQWQCLHGAHLLPVVAGAARLAGWPSFLTRSGAASRAWCPQNVSRPPLVTVAVNHAPALHWPWSQVSRDAEPVMGVSVAIMVLSPVLCSAPT
jgi:hypothetical protein